MTREEILDIRTMKDVMAEYGIKVNRNNMCSCPFHGADKDPSMKVYKNGYNCFACGANGDIFKFVMQYNNCDFKDAFLSLGGTYEHTTDKERKDAEYNRKIVAENRKKLEKYNQKLKHELSYHISLARAIKNASEPLSEAWCVCENKLQQLLHMHEEYEGKELPENELLRICQQVRQFKSVIE